MKINDGIILNLISLASPVSQLSDAFQHQSYEDQIYGVRTKISVSFLKTHMKSAYMLRKRFYRLVGYHLFLNFTRYKRSEEILEPNPEEFRCGIHKNQFRLGVIKAREEISFGRVSEFKRFHLSERLKVLREMGKLLNRTLKLSTLDDSNFFCYFLPAAGLTLIRSETFFKK